MSFYPDFGGGGIKQKWRRLELLAITCNVSWSWNKACPLISLGVCMKDKYIFLNTLLSYFWQEACYHILSAKNKPHTQNQDPIFQTVSKIFVKCYQHANSTTLSFLCGKCKENLALSNQEHPSFWYLCKVILSFQLSYKSSNEYGNFSLLGVQSLSII